VVALSAGSIVTANAAVTKASTGTPQLQLVSAGQACAGKVNTSAGNHWTCYVKPAVARRLLAGKSASPDAATPAASDQYCDGNNDCWVRSTATSGLYNGGLEEFGYGGEVLGYTVLNEAWTLSGTKFSTKASLTVYDDDIQWIVWQGYLGNSAPGTKPVTIKYCSQEDGPEDLAADTHTDSPSGWCTESDTANYNHFMNVQVSFQTSADGDTGFWWTNASSIVAHSASLPATSYTFDGPSSRPSPAIGAGYQAG
jgi:hypothetical protein